MPKLIVDFPDYEIDRINDNYYPASLFNIMTPIRYALENNKIYDDHLYEKGYDAGINEMYEAFRKIIALVGFKKDSLDYCKLNKIFQVDKPWLLINEFSAMEIINKIKEYEKEQEKYILDEGDEIIWATGENNEHTHTGIVTSISHCGRGVTRYSIIDKYTYKTYDNLVFDDEEQNKFTKTGKRYKMNFLDNLEEE